MLAARRQTPHWLNFIVILALILPQSTFAASPSGDSFAPRSGSSVVPMRQRAAAIASGSPFTHLSATKLYLPITLAVPDRTKPASAQDESPMTQSGPVFYLSPETLPEVHIFRPACDPDAPPSCNWRYASTYGTTQDRVVGLVFRAVATGPDYDTGKRMNCAGGEWALCNGAETMFENTTDWLRDWGSYYCAADGSFQNSAIPATATEICNAVAPGARFLGANRFYQYFDSGPGKFLAAAFASGGNTRNGMDARLDVYDIHFVYYGIPPSALADRSALSDPNAKVGQGDPRECPVTACNDAQGYVGDPINMYSGGFDWSVGDLSINTLAGPLVFQRTYASTATNLYSGTLGYGWTHNQDTRLIFPTDPGGEPGVVWFKAHTANQYRFTDNGDGTYTPYPGVLATLTKHTTTPVTYTLINKAQAAYTFDANGRLLTWADPQDRKFTYTYTAGRLSQVADPSGQRYLAFAYDAQSRLTGVSDHANRSVFFGYNAAGDLSIFTNTLGLTWTYAYTGAHWLSTITGPGNVVWLRNGYDAQGRVVRQYDGLNVKTVDITYNASSATFLDARGNPRTHAYDSRHTLTGDTNAQGGVISKTYYAHFRPASLADPAGHNTNLTWSTDGANLTQVIDAQGGHTQLAYDALNNLTRTVDALGFVTTHRYSGTLLISRTNALTQTWIYTYGTFASLGALLVAEQDPLGRVARYGYNTFGERTVITDALGGVTRFGYDNLGRLITTTDALGRMTVNTYDNADRLIAVTQNYTSTSSQQNYLDTFNLVTRHAYDGFGRPTLVTDTLGRVTRNGYDGAGRLVSATVNYSPTLAQNYLNQWNLVTRYGYDAIGNQVLVTDTLNRVTKTEYDKLNRPVTVTLNYSPSLPLNHLGTYNIRTVTGYDAVGNVVAQTDALSRATTFGYDALNRLIAVTDTLTGATRTGYDALGRRTVVTDASGVATHFVYDAFGQLVETRNALNHATRFGYDALGNRAVMTDAGGVVTRYGYDALSRLVAVTESVTTTAGLDANRYNVVTRYGYDALGNRTIITDARGYTTTFTYDALNRVIRESNPLSHTTRYQYDAPGNRVVMTDANTSVTRYAYDALNRLSIITYTAEVTPVRFAYDALGNRTAMTDTTGATTYVYDALNRPLTITSPITGVVGYRYDALGNRAQLVYPGGNTITYTYDGLNRVMQVTDWSSGLTRYTYDRAGRPLTTTLPNGVTTTYRYDAAGRLTNLTHTGRWWTVAAYTYTLDAAGNRLAVAERILPPTPPTYLPLVMKDTSDGGDGMMSGGGGESESDPFSSPLPTPDSDSFTSPLPPPSDAHSSGVVPASATSPYVPDVSLLVLVPVVLAASVHRRKGRRWSIPTLFVAATSVGISVLLPGGAAPAGAIPLPMPFLSPQSPPPDAGCIYPTSPITGTRVISYAYDSLYRLSEAASSGGDCFRYEYDRVGNRAAMTTTAGVTTYQYDAANRLTNVNGQAYTWDNNGSLTSNGVFTFTYNAAGRMAQAQNVTTTLTYAYNGDGLLVLRNSTRYVWDVAAGLPQMLGDGGNLYLPGVGQFDGAAWTYPLPDALGSVRQLADAQGYVVQRYDYGPFGEMLAEEGKRTSSLRYTGEQYDGDTGLLYLRARWYDATTGRFTTRDPFPGLAALPQTLHPYVYALNNPINLTDPSGEFVGDILDIASFFWSLHDFLKCPTWENLGWLALDVIGLLPVIPALGMVAKVGKLGDVSQLHHIVSNKIIRALNQHQVLRGLLSRNDLVVRAATTLSHKGYQTWHRLYDNEVVQWLSQHPNATYDDFLGLLREIYERPEMREAFPDALDILK